MSEIWFDINNKYSAGVSFWVVSLQFSEMKKIHANVHVVHAVSPDKNFLEATGDDIWQCIRKLNNNGSATEILGHLGKAVFI